MTSIFKQFKYDFPASIIVFFVAVPLCLGIALASGAPLFSGIISGIVGGIVVGIASGSALGVSGPAAGLAAIVLSAITQLQSWEALLLAVFLAGIIQVIAGYLGGGVIAYYFPSSVIKGMLAGIGIIIILKQLPFALGIDPSNVQSLMVGSKNNIFAPFIHLSHVSHLVAVGITCVSILLLIIWELILSKKNKVFQIIQGPMVVVLLGVLFVWLGESGVIAFQFSKNQLVNIPIPSSTMDFFGQFSFPDFSQWKNPLIYKIAAVMALVASLETLLSVEAADKLDPQKRITPTDRELKAQGLGNMLCGLIGGLPVTQVIVRSSANIAFGARSKLSSILHGVLLLICVATIPVWLNRIPLATLAAVLLVVGYKLTNPKLYKQMRRLGWEQFVPFVATVIGVVVQDLLIGIGIGMAVSVFIILRHNFLISHTIFKTKQDRQKKIHLTLAEEVSFLNKGSILHELSAIPPESTVIIDASKAKIIDHDVHEAIRNFMISASSNNITVEYIEGKEVTH